LKELCGYLPLPLSMPDFTDTCVIGPPPLGAGFFVAFGFFGSRPLRFCPFAIGFPSRFDPDRG
jgi:hypothetical protein